MTSIVFPGQGSQFVGMAKDFNDNFRFFFIVHLKLRRSLIEYRPTFLDINHAAAVKAPSEYKALSNDS